MKQKKKHSPPSNSAGITKLTPQVDVPNVQLSNAEIHLKKILNNKILFQQDGLDDTIFKSSLIIKIAVPNRSYVPRNQKIELGSLVRNYPHSMYKAYQAAYEQLFANMQMKRDDVSRSQVGEKQLLIRNFASYIPMQNELQQKHKKNNNYNGQSSKKYNKEIKLSSKQFQEESELIIECQEQSTGVLDSFTIYYNSFVYALQQLCGFKTKSFMLSQLSDDKNNQPLIEEMGDLDFIKEINNRVKKRAIYILLYLPDHTVIKTALKYKIKKEVDYAQIDPFLNDPCDRGDRPLRFHSQIRRQLAKNPDQEEGQRKSAKLQEKNEEQETQVLQRRKKIDRKIGFILPQQINQNGPKIINEKKLSSQTKRRYIKFCHQLNKSLSKVIQLRHNKDMFKHRSNEDKLSLQEKKYLYFVNRGKLNPGVEKIYMQIKKKRRYWQILEQMSKKYKYNTIQKPKLYGQFKLMNKSKKFFARLRKLLLYKQIKVSPYGDLALFNKMELIKLSYLLLKQKIVVENFYAHGVEIFALTDQFEKNGTVCKGNPSKFSYHYQTGLNQNQRIPEIKGGLDGHNLQEDWCRLFVWKTSIDTIRNYLGQAKAMQIFIKTQLIKFFVILSPFGVGFQIVKMLFIDFQAQTAGYMPQVYFFIIYMLIVSFSYGIFIQKYCAYEKKFIRNYVEQPAYVQFMDHYTGPYRRDVLTDNLNTYIQQDLQFSKRLKKKLTISLVYLLYFLILALETAFYYGIRLSIIEISQAFPQVEGNILHFICPLHLAGYSVYFIINSALDKTIINKISIYLTRKENRAKKEQFVKSVNLKRLMFGLFSQLIGPIDLIYIQYASKTSCFSLWCATEFKNYAYCRFIIVLAFSLYYTVQRIVLIILGKIKRKKGLVIKEKNKSSLLSYKTKLFNYLQFVYQESEKQPCKDFNITDETISLIHFAIFICVFPFSPVLSLTYMMFSYNIERQEILKCQRPIPKIENLPTYSRTIKIVGHLLIFFNWSYLFLTLQWFQFNFINILLQVSMPLSQNSVMTLKFSAIVLFFMVYQLVLAIGKMVGKKSHSFLDQRIFKIYKKYEMKMFNEGNKINLKLPKPLHSISRSFNLNLIKRQDKIRNDYDYQSGRDLYIRP